VGEIIGGVAVVFTIVYLAVQLRRSTRAVHRQTYHSAAESMSQFSWRLAENPELFRFYRIALQAPDTLPPEDLLRGFAVLDAYFSLMETFYLHNREFGEVLSQERWARMLRRLVGMPGGEKYWKERRWQFNEEFAAYVDGFMPEQS
jgi:hypothetical protein